MCMCACDVSFFLSLCVCVRVCICEHTDWVREMYAWDIAIAFHNHIRVRNERPPNSTTIVQVRTCVCVCVVSARASNAFTHSAHKSMHESMQVRL